MGLLLDGVWHAGWLDTRSSGGRFERKESNFRNWVTADGQAGPTGTAGFKAEPGRYHLYVSHACPWAHRTMIFRRLKKLEDLISVSVVDPDMLDKGWTFSNAPGAIADHVNGADHLYEVYLKSNPTYSGKVTVPVLWDKQTETIVNNESSEIIRMFNSAFDTWAETGHDYYPAALRPQIDATNDRVYDTVNNGVYKSGFATTQEAYEAAFAELFDTLAFLEDLLSGGRYLVGEHQTEADWRLFTTLVRFDPVYYGHFKCNKKRIIDYANLSNYLRDLYQMPGIAETTNFRHIKRHYYFSHTSLNPTQIVPVGPDIDLAAPHDRGRFSG